jgi:two-component system OmpR family sensor kinase
VIRRLQGFVSGLRRARLPLAAQIVALLVLSLLAIQAVSLVVLLALPQPRAPLYRTTDIEAGFDGRSLRPQFGRPLLRTMETAPPPLDDGWVMNERARRELAQGLRVPEARIRLAEQRPSFLRTLVTRPDHAGRLFQQGRARHGRGGPPDDFFGPQPGAHDPGPANPGDSSARFRREPPIVGSFVAAMQQPSGLWVVLRPEPEPFPNDWQRRVAFWFLGVFVVIAPVGYLFARRITAPLRDFARGAERLGRDPRAEPLAIRGPAEISAAASAFNEMQVRLQRYVEDRTAMVAAISHDLRTPLARVRFKIEQAPEALRDAIASDLEQMEKMIAAALSFTRDASEIRTREPVDLLSLLECVVDDAALVGADVVMEEADPVTVEADALALQRLFSNLVDNAVKYGGSARVQLSADSHEVRVDVADAGPGLPERDLERVFQPFYRGEPARTLDKGGIGLGLAVARSIARGHGGDITLTSSAGGLIAHVRLPLPGCAAA